MTTAYTQNQIAEGKIAMAIQRLGETCPFHAFIAEQFVRRACPEVKAAGVTIEGDSMILLYCADFIERSTLPELEAVFQQEVDQLVIRHVVDPAEFKETRARTVTERVAANERVNDPHSASAITHKSSLKLPPLESPCKRHKRSRKVKRRKTIAMSSPCTSPGSCPNPTSATANQPRGEANAGTIEIIGNHAVGAFAGEDRQRSAKVVREAVRDAAISVGSDQVPDWLQSAIAAMGVGNQPGSDVEQLRDDRIGKQNWTRVLRRYVGRALQARPDFMRPPRRFPHLAGIVPGRRYRASRPRIMAVIDTSASLDAEMLAVISSELARMARQFDVTVVECDVKIHRVYPYRPIEAVHGRGGTDLCPPFKPRFLKEHRPDVVVYFTDGFGPAPKSAPRVPVIWCLTPGGERPAPWGRSLQMEAEARE